MAIGQWRTEAVDERLLPGEVLESNDPEDARQWVTIYRELATFAERTVRRLSTESGDLPLTDSNDADQRALEAQRQHLLRRLDFWEQRLWTLVGLDLDIGARSLRHRVRDLKLTRRETQLLAFLAQRPGQFFSAERLVIEAWGAPELAPEQLRTYIVRLRRRLAEGKIPARLVVEPRRGYSLVLSA